MNLRLLVITWSVISCSLSLNHDVKPHIILPSKGPPMCVIGNVDCLQPLTDIQWHLKRTLDIQRYRVATGYYDNLPIATDMLLMEMDDELRNKAQAYAETCLPQNNMQYCPQPEGYQDGEVSIFVAGYHRNIDMIARHRADLTLMAALSQSARFSDNELEQLVKKSTILRTETIFHESAKFIHSEVWKVGCGFADFLIPNSNKFKEVIVCFFGPPKLKIGKRLYIAGCVLCSNCPGKTSCLKEDLPGLCKVESGKLPLYNEHKKWEKNICMKPEEANEPIVNKDEGSSNEPIVNEDEGSSKEPIVNEDEGSHVVWHGNPESNLQQCKGTNLCSLGWTYKHDYAYIEVKESCISIDIFREKIYIEEESCFTFSYRKSIDPSLTNSASVIAFAFEENDQRHLRLKEKKHGMSEVNFTSIYLDLPWSDANIYVGFGTLSTESGDGDWYEIELRNFKIENGKCPLEIKEDIL